METSPARSSLLGLIRMLTGDTRTFVRQEIQLAKTEISEKVSRLGKNTAALAVGGFVAYAGLIVLLFALGCLGAWLFEKLDLAPLLSGFLGFAAIGLLVTLIGVILLLKGLRTIKRESLAPQRTLYTLQELKSKPQVTPQEPQTPKPSSEEMQARVEATENRMGDTLDELGRRLSPTHINAQVKDGIRANPYRSGLIAMAAGLVSGLLLRRKFHHA